MPITDLWQSFGPDEWADLAERWLGERRGTGGGDAGETVVLMNFTAAPERQWEFILAAVAAASSDDELAHIAAGPIEHLLGFHGERWIARIEREAGTDCKFARALTGVWQHLMTDAVWARVRALQAQVSDPLP